GRNLRAGLGEAKDIVDEEQHIAPLDISQVFGHRQTGQGHAQTRTRGLVHLPIDHYQAPDYVTLDHLFIEIVALACALAYACEDAVATVVDRDIVDQFLDNDGLAYSRPAKGANLPAFHKGANQVDDLNSRLQQFGSLALILKRGRWTVNGQSRPIDNLPPVVDGLA